MPTRNAVLAALAARFNGRIAEQIPVEAAEPPAPEPAPVEDAKKDDTTT